jgi:hypothetical protein
MKTLKLAIAVLVLVALVTAVPVQSFAALAACTCTVVSAGPVTYSQNNPAYYKMAIRLTYVSGGTSAPTTTTKTFYAPGGHEKEFLAVALTAIANGKNVSAMVDFDGTGTKVYNLSVIPVAP